MNRKEENETRLLGRKEPCANGKLDVAVMKETAGQEETRKLGNKTTERLLLNVAIIKFPEELHVSTCAGSYAVLNCRNDNNFFLFFPRVSSAQSVNIGCVIKAIALCRILSSSVTDKVEGQGIAEGEKVGWLL